MRFKPSEEFTGKLRLFCRQFSVVHKMEPQLLPATLLSSLLKTAAPFINIYMSARIVDALLRSRTAGSLALLAGLTVVLNLAASLSGKAFDAWQRTAERRMGYLEYIELARLIARTDYQNIENPVFHMQKQKIVDAIQTGEQRGLGVVASHLGAIAGGLFAVVFSTLLAFPLFLPASGHAGRSLVTSPFLSFLFLALLIFSSVFSVFSNARFSKVLFRKMDQSLMLNRLFRYYLDRINDVAPGKDARIYRQSARILQNFDAYLGGVIDFTRSVGKMRGRFVGVNATISAALGGFVYLFVGFKALLGIFSIGSVVQYVGAISQFTTGLSGLIAACSNMWLNLDYVELYLDFLNTPSILYRSTIPVEKRSDNEHEIEFRHVSFRYPGSKDYAIYDLSLRLRIGKRLAVVGRNGSGKTTFIKLLCRLYDPTEGEILLNGIDVRKYDYDEYLRLFSVVFQDFQLFAFSAGQNVAARVDYDPLKTMNCIDAVGVGERVRKMLRGMDTPLYRVDEDGVEISGGESQKLALARAIYKDTPFIVLDEPTAALDPIAEHEIYSKFDEIVGNKTAIYISHRLSSCRFCDDIAVFHEGRLIQRGSHEKLIQNVNGKYYELWSAQEQYYTEKIRWTPLSRQ